MAPRAVPPGPGNEHVQKIYRPWIKSCMRAFFMASREVRPPVIKSFSDFFVRENIFSVLFRFIIEPHRPLTFICLRVLSPTVAETYFLSMCLCVGGCSWFGVEVLRFLSWFCGTLRRWNVKEIMRLQNNVYNKILRFWEKNYSPKLFYSLQQRL